MKNIHWRPQRLDYLEFIVRITSNIPDKGQVTVRYYGFSANAHRGKVKKTIHQALPLQMVEDELRPICSKGWTEKIRKAATASIRQSGRPDNRRDRG
jgi:hypothetical protein